MAAAALGHAALRIGGRALQRAALSPAAQRRLVHTRVPTHDEKIDVAARLMRIQDLKEELYNQIAACKDKYMVSGNIGRNNTHLLEHLSEQIKPRHDDPRWRSCRRWAFVNDVYKYSGAVFIATTAANLIFYSVHKIYPREENNDKRVLDAGLKNVFSC
ncbi:uncharacterized protein [Triticum aestivum]|uniref:uncharacterized protein n=1 Tax=Triticum aestivum TaxID=4565 RepID=UPI000844A3CF|nr:uncharacterized protein LOC123183448 [Triticum aestivum]